MSALFHSYLCGRTAAEWFINMKRGIKSFVVALLLSLGMELFYFNLPFFLSITDKPVNMPYTVGDGLSLNDDGTYTVKDKSNVTIEFQDINADTGYIYIDLSYCLKSENVTSSVQIKMTATDEGHALPYSVGSTYLWDQFPKTMYVRPNFYGNALSLTFSIAADVEAMLEIRSITLHANVPLFFSGLRFCLITIILAGILILVGSRSFSSMRLGDKPKMQRLITFSLFLINAAILWYVVQLDMNFKEPNRNWIPDSQYKLLAEALAQGRVDISPWNKEQLLDQLASLSNPYDRELRIAETGIRTPDVAYYNNNLYVYFGIVPVLLYYLPFYLLTGHHIYNWIAIYISAVAIVAGAYYLLHNIIRKYYPHTPFFIYILLSTLLGNGSGVITTLMIPYFYSLPISTALAFSLWGIGLWISSSRQYALQGRKAYICLIGGSLCMAMVAGCRPQFLLGSFLVFPIFWKELHDGRKLFCGENLKTLILGFLPYIVIAVGVMYYNYIRFASPLDFGANYNITSNDMTKRGFNLGRISDGLYMYLYQLPVIFNAFPFLRAVAYNPTYLGETIYEPMFGGVFFTHIFTCMNFMVHRVRIQLKKKGLFSFVVICFCFAVLIVITDTEMAAILPRYYNDFLWLFTLSGIFIFLQLWENAGTFQQQKMLTILLVAMIAAGCAIDFAIGINSGNYLRYSPSSYFLLQNCFT